MNGVSGNVETSFVPGWGVGLLLTLLVAVIIWWAVFGDREYDGIAQYDDEDNEVDGQDSADDDEDYVRLGDDGCWAGPKPRYTVPDEVQSRMTHHLDPTVDELREAVIGLWNECGGWIPGASYADLAYVLGVPPARLLEVSIIRKARERAALPPHNHDTFKSMCGPTCPRVSDD